MQNSGKRGLSRVNKDGIADRIQQYIENTINTQICPHIVQSLASDLQYNTDWMVELNEHYDCENKNSFRDSLIGHTHIIMGEPQCGKKGLMHWRKEKDRQQNIKVIEVDCIYHPTPSNFGSELVEQLAELLDKSRTKKSKKGDFGGIQNIEDFSNKMTLNNNINLSSLDQYIQQKPLLRIVLALRHAEVLVESKKQTVLYNLFDWMKSDIKSQVGLVLLTSHINFVEKLEKRVKSRMDAKTITIYNPRDQKKVKQIIQKRIQFSIHQAPNQQMKHSINRLSQIIQKSTIIEKVIKQEIDRCPKPIIYFLQIFKLIFSVQISDTALLSLLNNKQSKHIENQLKMRFERVRPFLCPFSKPQELKLQQMGYPELIMMGYIRKMILSGKSKISFKSIKREVIEFKVSQHIHGGSFDFSQYQFEKALKNLSTLKVIDIKRPHDFENAEIVSNLIPQQIKEAIQGRLDVPQYVRDLLS